MRKLIIDQIGLEQYEEVDYMLEFYPHGLPGLVLDYLTHYLAAPTRVLEETDRDVAFFDRVLEQYENSDQAVIANMISADTGILLVTIVVSGVGEVVREIVQQYGGMLHHGIFDPSLVDWGRGYLLVPMRS